MFREKLFCNVSDKYVGVRCCGRSLLLSMEGEGDRRELNDTSVVERLDGGVVKLRLLCPTVAVSNHSFSSRAKFFTAPDSHDKRHWSILMAVPIIAEGAAE